MYIEFECISKRSPVGIPEIDMTCFGLIGFDLVII
jgi:hypothetical protein